MTKVLLKLIQHCKNISSTRPLVNPIIAQDVKTKQIHSAAHYRSGALKPKPDETTFALGRVVLMVVPGLFIGAAISKIVANFLEENDLFVPEDDDDDDD